LCIEEFMDSKRIRYIIYPNHCKSKWKMFNAGSVIHLRCKSQKELLTKVQNISFIQIRTSINLLKEYFYCTIKCTESRHKYLVSPLRFSEREPLQVRRVCIIQIGQPSIRILTFRSDSFLRGKKAEQCSFFHSAEQTLLPASRIWWMTKPEYIHSVSFS